MSDQSEHQAHVPLEESTRFALPSTRRDFLGLAAIWAGVVAFCTALIGAMRLPMPSIFPESNSKAKIGPPDAFAVGSATELTHLSLWVFRDEKGLYAISSICTHLGCIAARDAQSGQYKCPCHGSVFKADGSVVKGPAPSALHWLSMSVAPDGQVVVDRQQFVAQGEHLVV